LLFASPQGDRQAYWAPGHRLAPNIKNMSQDSMTVDYAPAMSVAVDDLIVGREALRDARPAQPPRTRNDDEMPRRGCVVVSPVATAALNGCSGLSWVQLV
jgi:hypothetical protein